MNPRSVVRSVFIKHGVSVDKTLDSYLSKNPDWEVISVSHQFLVDGVAILLVLKSSQASLKTSMPDSIEEI